LVDDVKVGLVLGEDDAAEELFLWGAGEKTRRVRMENGWLEV
jgi:hypothetical protein